MDKTICFTAEFLKDGRFSVPQKIINNLCLKTGEKVKLIIEKKRFD